MPNATRLRALPPIVLVGGPSHAGRPLARSLEDAGLEVTTVTADEAVEVIASDRPDLVLLAPEGAEALEPVVAALSTPRKGTLFLVMDGDPTASPGRDRAAPGSGVRRLAPPGPSGDVLGELEREWRLHLERRVVALEREIATLDEARDADQERFEQFVRVVSHDLRAPLRRIAAFSERLQEKCADVIDERALEYLSRIFNGAVEGQHLVGVLVEYARLGNRPLELERTSLAELARSAAARVERLRQEKDGTLTLAPDLPDVTVDGGRLEEVIVRLFENALHFADPTRPPEITLEASAGDGEVLLSITDNGRGIEPEHLDRVFGILEQLHGKTTHDGFGLGLPVCRRLVEMHGGRIWLSSIHGSGTAAHVSLPETPEVRGASLD